MIKNGEKVFNDPDDYRACLAKAGIELELVFKGRFQAGVTRVTLRQLHLLQVRETAPRVAHFRLTQTFAFVTFPMEGASLMNWAGAPLGPDEVLFHGLGEQMHHKSTGACCWGAIALRPEDLAALGRALAERDLVPPPGGQVIKASRSAAARLRRLHKTACRLADDEPALVVHPEIARGLDQDLAHTLVNCLAEGEIVPEPPARQRHARIMEHFEQVLTSQGAARIAIPKLCSILEVSERGLRICCAKFLGMSPGRYRRLRQMHAARLAMRHADPGTGVSELARRYGFSEPGRFAVAYRVLFGERPSDTLRNSERPETAKCRK